MIKLADSRIDIDAYPGRALFEGIINAVAHRDYFLDRTQHDKAVLSFCYPLARKAGEIAEYLGISDSSYLRKKVLENLVVNGYLTKETKARTSYYKTVREAVTAL